MAQHEKPHMEKPDDTGVLGPDCGHHCGVITVGLTDQHIAHCNCEECHGEPKAELPLDFTLGADSVDPRGIR